MPSINMIAPRRAEKLRLQRDTKRLAIVILAELVFVVCLGGWMFTKMWSSQVRLAELNQQLTKLQPVVKQIEDYQSSTKMLAPKLDLLGRAKNQTMSWYNTLDRLTQSLPQATYLTRIATTESQAGKDEKTIVTLGGISSEQAKVGEVMMRLQAIPDFEDVNLSYTRENNEKNNSGIEFEIGASIKSDKASAKGVKSNGSNQS